MFHISVGVGLLGIKNPERNFAADRAAATAFGAAVDAASSATGRLMNLVDGLSPRITDNEGRYAPGALLGNGTERVAARGKRGGLIAAALAETDG